MRFFLFLIILASLIQGSFLPISLGLLLIINRALLVSDSSNLVLAFIGGVCVGLLTGSNVGFYALIYILIVELIEILKKSPISITPLFSTPVVLGLLLILAVLERIFLNQSINVGLIVLESILSIPIFIFVRFWEERYVVSPPLKLRV